MGSFKKGLKGRDILCRSSQKGIDEKAKGRDRGTAREGRGEYLWY